MGTDGPNKGTNWESLAYVAQQNGVSTKRLNNSNGKGYRRGTLDDLKSELSLGRSVMLLVRYWKLPIHEGEPLLGGDLQRHRHPHRRRCTLSLPRADASSGVWGPFGVGEFDHRCDQRSRLTVCSDLESVAVSRAGGLLSRLGRPSPAPTGSVHLRLGHLDFGPAPPRGWASRVKSVTEQGTTPRRMR